VAIDVPKRRGKSGLGEIATRAFAHERETNMMKGVNAYKGRMFAKMAGQ
jgi:hypothetical protein